MSRVRRKVALCALLSCAGSVRAQDRDPFDLDTFIDPRDLGAAMRVNGKTVPGAAYETVTTSVGRVWNYQDRETFTKRDREFATVGYFRYWSDLQADATLAVLDHQSRATKWRATVELAQYSLLAPTRNNMDSVGRNGISLVLDDNLGSPGTSYEIDGTITVQTLTIIPKRLRILGAVTIGYRRSEGENTLRALYATTTDLPHPDILGDRLRFNVGLCLGYESQEGRGRVLPVKGRGLIDYFFGERYGLEVSYGPAYQFASAGVPGGFNNEWMIMVFGNVYSRRNPAAQ